MAHGEQTKGRVMAGKEPKYMNKTDARVTREKKAVVVERELDKMYEKHGSVSTDLMLEEAKDPKHPLHKYFDWDDEVAGKKWRQTQALAMIMATKYVAVINGQSEPPKVVHGVPVRKFVSAFKGEGFKMRNEALNEEESRRALIERRLGVLRSWCRENIDIAELQPVRLAILEHIDDKEKKSA